MHPVGLVQQQPGALGHRRPVAQDVAERRGAGPRRVRRVARLGQLLRVAQQHQVPGRAGHGQDVGQRQLPRLVHEQGVHAVGHAGARPQPDRARGHVELAVAQRPLQLVVRHVSGRSMQERVALVCPLADPQRNAVRARAPAQGADQLVNDRVRRSGDASRAALRDQRQDLLGAGVGLPGSRRPLQRQVRTAQQYREPQRSLGGRLAIGHQRPRHQRPRH